MTAGLWQRFEDGLPFTRIGRDGKGRPLTLEDACACLRPTTLYVGEGEAAELEANDACKDCDGGRAHARRFAVDLWRILDLDPVPPALLDNLLTVERLASYGLRWTTLDERGAPEGALDWQRQRRCAA